MNTIGEHNVGRYQEIQHSFQQFREIGGGVGVGGLWVGVGGLLVMCVCVCVCVCVWGGGGGGGGGQTPSISNSKSQNLNVSRLVNWLYPIHWSQVLSPEWRYSWSNANRRCSNYIWVINKVIAY